MMRMLADILEMTAAISTLIVGCGAAVFLLMSLWAWQVGPRMCTAFGEGMKLETHHAFWHGCFVTMPDGRTLPKNVAEKVLQQEYRLEVQTK